MAQKNTYRDSPFGPVEYPHFNKPDDKYNKENPPFHGTQVLEGSTALDFKERIDAAVDKAFEDYFSVGQGKDIPKGQQKSWGKYYPYEEVEDDETGDKTGTIKFDFKQNSVIRTATEQKHITIGLYDADGNEMDPAKDFVRNGSVVRFRYSMRPITLKTNKQVGVRLDFSSVQVKEMAQGNGGGGFGKVEGSYKAGSTRGQRHEDDRDDAPDAPGSDVGGDY